MNTIEEIKNKVLSLNLKDFAERHYGASFKQEGNLYSSCCILPNHNNDDTPSLFYYPDTNTLSCFGCNKLMKSNIINFVGLMENKETNGQDFIEILKIICEKENIDFQLSKKPVDPEVQKLLEHKTRCSILYRNNLWDNQDSYGFSYLTDERELTKETIRAFHLGLTSDNESKYGRSGISNRICIPILNAKGDGVIACSFRQLSGSDSERKYLHDSNDKIFSKKDVFYGYSHAVEHIRKTNHVYIVEGYFDMISLYQSGIKNTMACMSNRMTEEQIKLLSKLAKNVTIIIDQDKAGFDGFKNTLPIMLEHNLNVRVVPSLNYMGKDANDMCIKLKWDSNKIQALINSNSKDATQYILSTVLDKFDDAMLKLRYGVMSSTTSLLSCIADPIKRKNYEAFINSRIGL